MTDVLLGPGVVHQANTDVHSGGITGLPMPSVFFEGTISTRQSFHRGRDEDWPLRFGSISRSWSQTRVSLPGDLPGKCLRLTRCRHR